MATLKTKEKTLSDYTYSDYLRQLQTIESDIEAEDLKPIKIAVLRSYTVESIEPVLKLRLLMQGYRPTFYFAPFNQYAQEALDPASQLHQFKPDLILFMLRIEEVMTEFVEDFPGRDFSQWESVIEETAAQIESLAAAVSREMPAQMLFQNMALAKMPYWGVYDAQQVHSQSSLVDRLNQLLAQKLRPMESAFVWDFGGFLRRFGHGNIHDPKMWYVSKNPYKQSAYPALVDDLFPYVLSVIGKAKKCIVLDLDNTLWGGVAGEDGLEGVALGHNYPGNCYLDFQKGLLKFYQRGIILAINSKNNESDALEIIEKHPYMVLRKKHFAAMEINWQDKASNIGKLAHDLNLGVESFIFIDDNPMECAMVRESFPECDVIQLPEKPYLIPEVLQNLTGLENIRLTDEDRKKGTMYQAQVARKHYEKSFNSLDDFLKGLDIEVVIESAGPFSIPRIAQLTQKTNQMNMTTRRYTEANIKQFADDPDRHVFAVSSKDRFGDNGIIGVCILKGNNEKWRIDTFLLSCRVIGRKIEDAILAHIVEFAKKNGAKKLVGEFIPTAKNIPAANFYQTCDFKRIDDTLYEVDLQKYHKKYPEAIQLDIRST